jgi:hypothetical protein
VERDYRLHPDRQLTPSSAACDQAGALLEGALRLLQQSAIDTAGISYMWLITHHTALDRPSPHPGWMGFAAWSTYRTLFFAYTYPSFHNCQVPQGSVARGANDSQKTKNTSTRSRSMCEDTYQRRGTGAHQNSSYELSLLAAV